MFDRSRRIVQASRLGFVFPPPDPGPETADAIALGDGSVVVVQRLGPAGDVERD